MRSSEASTHLEKTTCMQVVQVSDSTTMALFKQLLLGAPAVTLYSSQTIYKNIKLLEAVEDVEAVEVVFMVSLRVSIGTLGLIESLPMSEQALLT